MDHTRIHEEMIDLTNKMKKNVVKQTKMLNLELNKLTPEQREHFAKEQAELNRVLKVAGNGDTKELQKIIDKYANSDSNR
jgi:Icc-related predicted phosphoesterase